MIDLRAAFRVDAASPLWRALCARADRIAVVAVQRPRVRVVLRLTVIAAGESRAYEGGDFAGVCAFALAELGGGVPEEKLGRAS